MTQRSLALSSLVLSSAAVLGATASYALVYPARSAHSKWPIAMALLVESLAACVAGWLALSAHKRARQEPERFMAMLGLILGAFFLFVIVLGFGIPSLIHQTGD